MQRAWADFAKDPEGRGHGWDAVPRVGVFGAGEGEEQEVVVKRRQMFETVDGAVVDRRCALYQPLYDAAR